MLGRLLKYILYFLLLVILVTMANNFLAENLIIKYSLYFLEIAIIYFIFRVIVRSNYNFFNRKSTVLFSLLIGINIITSSYEPIYANLIKFFGYICFYSLGALYGSKTFKMERYKKITYLLIAIPFFIVAFFDHSLNQNLFFPNSNNFTYWGICSSFLYYTVNQDDKYVLWKSIFILLLYIGAGSSLGILSAVILSTIIINRNNRRLILFTILSSIIFVIMVLYSNLSVFERIRNVILIYQSMSLNDWKHLQDLNLYDLGQVQNISSNSRSDNTSSIWRMQQWLRIMNDFLINWYYAIFIGLGDNYTAYNFGLKPHSEFFRTLGEYGLIVFFIIYAWVKKLIKIVKNNKCYYFILAILIYHCTENLLESFPANSIFYLCLGYWYYYLKCQKMPIKESII